MTDKFRVQSDETLPLRGNPMSVNNKYYIPTHVILFLRPGYRPLTQNEPNTVAGLDGNSIESSKRLVFVTLSSNKLYQTRYDLSDFATLTSTTASITATLLLKVLL